MPKKRPPLETKAIGLKRLAESYKKNNRTSLVPPDQMEKIQKMYEQQVLPSVYEGDKKSSYPILYQSVVDATQGNTPLQQISNLELAGLTTIDSMVNSYRGKLYGTFSFSSGTYSLNLCKDPAQTQSVASGSTSTTGLMSLSAQNNSGLSGTVNVIGWTVNDPRVEAICYLSQDSDLPMDNLSVLADYNQSTGFAAFHLEAFEYIKTIVQSRYESILWDGKFLDRRQTNSGTGWFDLSRILNWQSPDLREASAQYAFYLIARKQGVSEDSVFYKRAQCAYNRVTAILQSTEMQFDTNYTRVPRKTRAASTFKISRA